jgi:DNA repair exonuclease SbcCD ATPase subunit
MLVFKKVRWRNFFSYGTHFTEISLNSHRSTLILGRNGAGKTTLIDALTFSLYGHAFRNCNKPLIPNSINGRDCVVEIEFSEGSVEYMVRRGLNPAIFEIYKNGNLVNQDAKSLDYQKYLQENILKMDFRAFSQVVVLASTSYTPFMDLKAAEKRAVIEELLNLSIFSLMNKVIKEHVGQIESELTSLNSKKELLEEKVRLQKSYVATLVQRNSEVIDEKVADIVKNEANIDQLQSEIYTLQSEANALLETVKDQSSMEKKCGMLEDCQRKIEGQDKKIVKEHRFFLDNAKCPTCSQEIDESFRQSKIDEKSQKHAQMAEALTKLSQELSAVNDRLCEIQRVLDTVASKQSEIATRQASICATSRYIENLRRDVESLKSKSEPRSAEEEQKLQSLQSEIETLEASRKENIENRHLYEIAVGLLKDTGIKAKIIKQYLPFLNKCINDYLQAMDFFVHFSLDENFSEHIKSRYRDLFQFSSFSQGEKLRINLALVFSLREIARLKNSLNCNLLILDEVMDASMDQQGNEDLLRILQTLDKNLNIFVVSHRSEHLSDKFSRTLRAEKLGNFSKLTVI